MIDLTRARTELATLREALEALGHTLATNVIRLHPGESIQSALDLAEADTVIELEPGVYNGATTYRRPVVVRPTVETPAGRRSPTWAPVVLMSAGDTVRIFGPDVVHTGLCYQSSNAGNQLITIAPGAERTVLDRPLVLGHPTLGQHRGIQAEGTQTRILGPYVDHIWRIGQDSQALYGANGTRDLIVDDYYFAAAGETVMFGGNDSSSPEMMPTGILMTNGVLTKRPEWYAMGAQMKNAFELKAAREVHVDGVEMAYAGIAEGQGGYLCVLTVRNQKGSAPWSTIENVVIENVVGHHAAGVCNFLGSDSNYPSETMRNVTLRHWRVTDLDRLGITKGAGWIFLFHRAPEHLTIEDVSVEGQNLNAGVYVIGAGKAPPTGLVMRDVLLPPSRYPFKLDDGGVGLSALQAYMPDAIFENVKVI
jgi:hypothetical protein